MKVLIIRLGSHLEPKILKFHVRLGESSCRHPVVESVEFLGSGVVAPTNN